MCAKCLALRFWHVEWAQSMNFFSPIQLLNHLTLVVEIFFKISLTQPFIRLIMSVTVTSPEAQLFTFCLPLCDTAAGLGSAPWCLPLTVRPAARSRCSACSVSWANKGSWLRTRV